MEGTTTMVKIITIFFLSFILSFAAIPALSEEPARDLTQIAIDQQYQQIEEINCMTEAMYFEARGEKHIGALAVAHVILNRMKSGKFPETACGVIRQKGQFTYKPTKRIHEAAV